MTTMESTRKGTVLTLKRVTRNAQGTYGELSIVPSQGPVHVLFTVELPWRNNRRRVSCIPAGRYEVRQNHSPKFGWSLHLIDVPGRSEILVHVANRVSELAGCIAPGMRWADIDGDGVVDVSESRRAMGVLRQSIKWPCAIEIVDAFGDGPGQAGHQVTPTQIKKRNWLRRMLRL